ncbi:MAG: ABC transporter substrate-binding protein, partial [Pseudomonadota bacterium]
MKTLLTTLSAAALLCAGGASADDADAAAFRDAFLGGSASWEDVTARAKEEGVVNLYYWGGSDRINVWMD